MSAEQKLKRLQNKVDKIAEKLEDEIRGLCEVLQYQDSSRMSYNIDRVKILQTEINDFQILCK